MNYSLCTISFRHELVSFQDLVQFAHGAGFYGIELWGVHAKALYAADQFNIQASVDRLTELNLEVSMISDYLNIMSDEAQFRNTIQKCNHLIDLAQQFKTTKIRIFAGEKSSLVTSEVEWNYSVKRLRQLTKLISEKGMILVVETHPGTLADNLTSVLRLLAEVDDKNLCINLDFLHLWESGTSPKEAYEALKSKTIHFHFKNIGNVDQLDVFSPLNIYSPNGSREGIVPLSEGAINYKDIIDMLVGKSNTHPASLEWFGSNPFHILQKEIEWLRLIESREKTLVI